jgi:peptidoglycan hydrolase CwlO-like protein
MNSQVNYTILPTTNPDYFHFHLQELRQTIMDTTQNALDLAEQLDKQRATINQLQSERASSNGQASQRESEWTAQIQSLQDKIAQLQEEAARQADENEMRAQAHRTEVETLTARFKEESEKAIRRNELERAGLLGEFEKREEAIREVLKERDDLLHELDDHVPKVQGLEDEVWSTRERMREVLDESTKLKEDLTKLQQRAEGMEQEFVGQNARAQGELAEARAKIEALEGALGQTQQETQLEAETRVKGLEADWAAKLEKLTAEYSIQIAELQRRIEEMREDGEAARRKIDEEHAREIAELRLQHVDEMESLARNRQGDEENKKWKTALEIESLRQKFESDAAVREEVHQRDLQFLQQRLAELQADLQRSRQEAQEALAVVGERERGLEQQIRQERDSLEREWRAKEMEAKGRQEGLEQERQRDRDGFERERAEMKVECDR